MKCLNNKQFILHGILFLQNFIYFVHSKPRYHNGNWILTPSREDSHSNEGFHVPKISDIIDRLWSFGTRENLLPDINTDELIKRIGIVTTSKEEENNWAIPPSRAEDTLTEKDKINENIIPNIKAPDALPDDEETNIISSWTENIPTKIRYGINTLTADLIYATQKIRNRIDQTGSSFVDNLKQTFNFPNTASKEPKKDTQPNKEYSFNSVFVAPVKEYFSKLFGPIIDSNEPKPLETATNDNALTVEEKISSLYRRISTMLYMARR